MRKLLFINLFLLVNFSALSQVDCEDFLDRNGSLNDRVFTGYYENPPTVLEKEYFNSFSNTNDGETGKVFVRFVVDTLGNVHCAKVIKSDNKQLNVKALEIIESTKFTPAMNRGKKIIAPMVLSITFGEPSKKKATK